MMAFEAFEVLLQPELESPLSVGETVHNVVLVSEWIQARFPQTRWVEEKYTSPILVLEKAEGILEIRPVIQENASLSVFVRFAYANPRAVESLFCALCEQLMREFDLKCEVCEDMSADLSQKRAVHDPDDLCAFLLPAIAYNRAIWHADWGDHPLVPTRPGDAVARFVAPKLAQETMP